MGDKSSSLSHTQTKYLSLATRVAALHTGKFKHGAVLVKGGRVLATAPNIYRNRPDLFTRENPNDVEAQLKSIHEHCSVHAEVRVVKSVTPEQARGSTVYVARVNKNDVNISMMSRPCKNCYNYMLNAGVKAVVYTEGDVAIDMEIYRKHVDTFKSRDAALIAA